MICFPNAKINLGLNVVEKRADGYHNIETVFYPIPLKDALEIVPAQTMRFTPSGIPVGGPEEKNLVIKAWKQLKEHYRFGEPDIYLHKSIPFGAGLGGGSSDAAFMLKLLNDQYELHIPQGELEQLAGTLGADCPFFIRNTPVFATGTGNQFEPVELSLKSYTLILVKPDIHVSTPKAYSMITPAKPSVSLKEIIRMPIQVWKEQMINDFEAVVFPLHPEIRQIKEKLYEAGAVYAAMSGSGSSVFGLFTEETNLHSLFPEHFYWQGKLEL